MIGEQIKIARNAKGLSQEELGRAIGITGVAIMRYEKEQRTPSKEMIEKIAKALDILPTKLYGWDEFAKNIKKENSFLDYLKSLGYSYSTETIEVLESHIEDVTDNVGNVIGQTKVIDKEVVNHLLSKDGVASVFTEAEFTALKDKTKESLEGAILLQSLKNKKEKPSSATTDNGSNNENTIK